MSGLEPPQLDFPTKPGFDRKLLHLLLKRHWGVEHFRPLQLEIIEAVLQGHSALGLLPTGGGKSLCYQLPALVLPGVTLVISPLIALMKDQVEQLERREIPATFINSNLSEEEINRRLYALERDAYRLLYLAPERLDTRLLQQVIERLDISLIAVDEAHCISQWGYDFRPSYGRIADFAGVMKQTPVLALTATATPEVQRDMAEQLGISPAFVFCQTFRRTNLRLFVLEEEIRETKIRSIVHHVEGSGIIYVPTRRLAQDLARILEAEGIEAVAYHAGMKPRDRQEAQQSWQDGTKRVIVATNAFGMGIDKPDVRFVVHYRMPENLESYFQEVGRAGRDGEISYAVGFYSEDQYRKLLKYVRGKFPTPDEVQKVYNYVCDQHQVDTYSVPSDALILELDTWSRRLGIEKTRFLQALRWLEEVELIRMDHTPDHYGYIRMIASDEVLSWYMNDEHYADLLETILRQLGGEVFRTTKRFSPMKWAELMEVRPGEIHRKLKQLHEREIVHFIPPTGLPNIRFLRPRVSIRRGTMNWELKSWLQTRAEQRLAALNEYALDYGACRMLALLQYFGEDSRKKCGICDICSGYHNADAGRRQEEEIYTEMVELLGRRPLRFRDVLERMRSGTEKQRSRILRKLIRESVIVMQEDYTFRLR